MPIFEEIAPEYPMSDTECDELALFLRFKIQIRFVQKSLTEQTNPLDTSDQFCHIYLSNTDKSRIIQIQAQHKLSIPNGMVGLTRPHTELAFSTLSR